MEPEPATANRRAPARWLVAAGAALLAASAAPAQELSGHALVEALQQGGYVIVMRHAESPGEPPGERERAPGNIHGEREIDQHGQAQMGALGYAFREFGIPVDQTLTSPAYRTMQSAQYFGFGERVQLDELAGPRSGGDPDWLRERVTQAPPDGENIVIVTHGGLLAASFGEAASGIQTAESLIFRAGGAEPDLVARITVEEWARLAVEHAGGSEG